jgi:dihydrofolate reductase
MNLTLIAAVDKNYGIGYQGQLLWHLPADMAFFRKKTLGHMVLMGRKTFDSIGRPLKDRENMVITHQPIEIPGVKIVHHLEELANQQEEVMVLGGGEIYQLCLPYAKRIILTEVDAQLTADAFFPKFDKNQFQCVSEDYYPADEKNIYNMSFKEYIRNANESVCS